MKNKIPTMSTFAVICLVCAVGLVQGWSYSGVSGPTYWSNTYPDCGHQSQSPIDLDSSDTEYDEDLTAITFTGYDTAISGYFTLANDGHGAKVSLNADTYPTVASGGLPDTYWLAQFHFHWGSDSSQGSEHTVDGEQYAAELHFVHVRNGYADITAAVSDSQGLAVVGVLIEESGSDNAAFSAIISALSDVVSYEAEVNITAFALVNLLPSDSHLFYRYNGSLTTPGCYEAVVWTVLSESISLSTTQLNYLRALLDSNNDTIVVNYRPTQELNDRTIFISDETIGAGSKVTSSVCVLFFLTLHVTLI